MFQSLAYAKMKYTNRMNGPLAFLVMVSVAMVAVNCDERELEREDCKGFNQVAKSIESFTKQYSVVDSCKSFRNCSGVHCTGSAFRKPFNFSLGVKQCKDPLKLWVHLTAPDLNIDEQKLLTNGATVYLLKDKPIGTGLPVTVSSYVVPNLQKKDNNITISARFCLAITTIVPSAPKCMNINQVSLPLSNEMCPGLPIVKPTKILSTTPRQKETSTGGKATGKPSSTKGIGKTSTPKKAVETTTGAKTDQGTSQSTNGGDKSVKTTPSLVSTKGGKKTTKMATKTVHPGSNKGKSKHHKGNHGSGISTGTQVAIVTSLLLAVLLLIGVVVYWRRLKMRRPAYYNDINVNREEDEEPFIDSHLVL